MTRAIAATAQALGLRGNNPVVIWAERLALVAAALLTLAAAVGAAYALGELLLLIARRRWRAAGALFRLLVALLALTVIGLSATLSALDALDLIPD